MPALIDISKSRLAHLAYLRILANTPISLFNALLYENEVQRLKSECSLDTLLKYYDYITTRAERTDISIGLAYTVFVSILIHDQFTSSRLAAHQRDWLDWGTEIIEYALKHGKANTIIQLPMPEAAIQHENIP